MKQLFYTSCKQGDGLQARAGLQIRAASDDVGEQAMHAAVKYCYYFLPFGDEFRPDIVKPEDAPIRFAFLQTPELGAVALQAIYYGIDPASGRPGNPFVHLVFQDESKMLDGYRVLASWQSPFWMRDAKGAGKQLSEVGELPQDGLDDSILSECAEEEQWRDNVEFLVRAFLQLEESQQIFIVGDPPDIVGMLLAVARVLPVGLRKKLSFSTYERDIEGQLAKFVGTTWGTLPSQRDLPEHCYAGRAVTLNLKSGRRSEGLMDLSYTGFAVEAICDGALETTLDPFLAFCDRCGLAEARDLQLLFETYYPARSQKRLDAANLDAVLRYAVLTKHAFSSQEFCDEMVGMLEGDAELLERYTEPVRTSLTGHEEAKDAFSEYMFEAFLNRAEDGAIARLSLLREAVLPLLPTEQQILVRVFRHFADQQQSPSRRLAGEVWLYLCRIWLGMPEAQQDGPRFAGWLVAEDAQALVGLVRSVSDQSMQLRVLQLNFVKSEEAASGALRRLLGNTELVGDLLQQVADAGSEHLDRVVKAIRSSARAGYLLELMSAVDRPDTGWILPLLPTLGARDGERFLVDYGRWMLEGCGDTEDFQAFLTRIEAQDHKLLIGKKEVWQLYRECTRRGLLSDEQLLRRIRAWELVDLLIEQGFQGQQVPEIRGQLQCILPVIRGAKIDEQLFISLARDGNAVDAVFDWGPAIVTSEQPSPSDIRLAWLNLCEAVLADKRAASDRHFVTTMFRIRVGAVAPDENARQVFLVEPRLERPGVRLLKKMPQKYRAGLNRESRQWPEASQEAWQNWTKRSEGLLTKAKRMIFGKKEESDDSVEDDRED